MSNPNTASNYHMLAERKVQMQTRAQLFKDRWLDELVGSQIVNSGKSIMKTQLVSR